MNTQQYNHQPIIHNSDTVIFDNVNSACQAEHTIKSRAKVTMTIVDKVDTGWVVNYCTHARGWDTLRMQEWEASKCE